MLRQRHDRQLGARPMDARDEIALQGTGDACGQASEIRMSRRMRTRPTHPGAPYRSPQLHSWYSSSHPSDHEPGEFTRLACAIARRCFFARKIFCRRLDTAIATYTCENKEGHTVGALSFALFELAVELDFDQRGAAALEALADQVGRVVHGLRPLRRGAEGARETDEIDCRIVELHADISVDLRGMSA